MRPQDKNTMTCNLRQFLNGEGTRALGEHQVEALQSVEQFLRLPTGSEYTQRGSEDNEALPVMGHKKGDFFEIVSATGSGKTRMFGTMAKAMDVPTLIVTPRNLLNKQTMHEFCVEVGIPEADVAVYDSKQPLAMRKRVLEGNPPPQFVITSYQSLPSLLDRHELELTNHKDVHYRPLIILDEVHEGQGAKTAATIDKLKDHVLLAGFTATDAGAHQTIFSGQTPIFNLPLVEAVKRGLLCNGIRTGVIDVKIDEDWISNFQKTPAGHNYKQEDIARFARTPAVIDAALRFHFSHDDPELGKISRLPTVFYTQGVAAAREGAAAYNKRASELGLSLKAAYVSGEMGEKVSGPIMEQFKRGEINAVFNDKLLGMGFDARNATVCYSLQPANVPDVVEQQLGRVGRKQGGDYVEKYGQDKVALGINVRAEGMNPYLFAQILQGPSLYSRKVSPRGEDKGGVKAPPPTLPGAMVHIDYDDLTSVVAAADKKREALPYKGDWETADNLQKQFVGKHARMMAILKDYQDFKAGEFIATGMSKEEAAARVAEEFVGMRVAGRNTSLCLSPVGKAELISQGKLYAQTLPDKGNWKVARELEAQYLGGDVKLREILITYHKNKTAEIMELKGINQEEAVAQVAEQFVGMRLINKSNAGLCISPIGEMELVSQGKLRKNVLLPKGNWKSANDLESQYMGCDRLLLETIKAYQNDKIEEIIRTQGLDREEAEKHVATEFVGMRRARSTEALCLSPPGEAELKAQGKLRQDILLDKGDWKSLPDLDQKYIGSHDKIVGILADYQKAKISEIIKDKKVNEETASAHVAKTFVGMRRAGRKEALCLSPQGEAELKAQGKLRINILSNKGNWQSIQELERRYVGGNAKQRLILLAYQEDKISETMRTRGISREDASAIVSQEFVGMRITGISTPALCLSPAGEKELVGEGKLKNNTLPPIGNWKSASRLKEAFDISDSKLRVLLEDYRRAKIDEMMKEKGISIEEATTSIAEEFIGMRLSGKNPALCLGPAGEAELVAQGKLQKRKKTAEETVSQNNSTDTPDTSSDSSTKNFTGRIKPRDITPSSDHLKRTGRTRAKNED